MITVSFKVEEYLNMFRHVAESYLRIMICFLPYLMGFAGAFQGDYVKINVDFELDLLNASIKAKTFSTQLCIVRIRSLVRTFLVP